MFSKYTLLILIVFTISYAQELKIPQDRLLSDSELISLLKDGNPEINKIKLLASEGNSVKAAEDLSYYFKTKMSERFFFDWKNFEEQFNLYIELFPDKKTDHIKRAKEHISLFPSDTKWKLPFKGENGEDINPYIFQHLSRQHKMLDIAFVHFINGKDEIYLNYFIEQLKSLNRSYFAGNIERSGNDVFEYFRAGYRVFNWLFIHNMFLASEKYKPQDQLLVIKTLLYHAAELYQRTDKYKNGNHHTKGVMALGMFAIIFNEFRICEDYYKSALKNLVEHLRREVNPDGFQFERSVHYHIGDIDNYYYFYYLSKLNGKNIPEYFQKRFRDMFDALVKIAMPDKHLPVLQDDTDQPWAEFNEAQDPMTLGSVLFEDPVFKYFTDDVIPSGRFWFISEPDKKKFYNLKSIQPEYNSVGFSETGYYIMRNGWKKEDSYMIISAGLSEIKPDHQHGDILGMEAFAGGNMILPNYQVRYFLNDFKHFKNSFSKNLAIVDSIPQGKYWKGNAGSTGFGKWLVLPKPGKITWISNEEYDYFSGTHDAYDSLEVNYTREVIFVKDGFWIVKDNFNSASSNYYYQIWQGNYDSKLNQYQIRSSFANGAGLEIVQLNKPASEIFSDSKRGKGYSVFVNKNEKDFSYITLLYPYKHFDYRIETETFNTIALTGWTIENNDNRKELFGSVNSKAKITIKKEHLAFLINVTRIEFSKGAIDLPENTSAVMKKSDGDDAYELTILAADGSEWKNKDLYIKKMNEVTYDNTKIRPGETYIIIVPE